MNASLVRRVAATIVVLALSAIIAVGCGGGGGAKSGAGKAATDDKGLAFVPASALLYMVVDTDFEGDSWKQFEEHAKQFKGYAKARKDALDDLAKDEDVSYDTDIKPWLGDTAGIAVLSVNTTKIAGDAPAESDKESDGEFIAWLETKDAAKAKTFVNKNAKKQGSSDYEGSTITESQGEGSDEEAFFWTIKDEILLLSDSEKSIKTALKAAKSGKSIADDDDVKDVAGEVGGDALAAIVLNGDSARDLIDDATKSENKSAATLSSLRGIGRVKALTGAAVGFEAEEAGFRVHGFVGYDKDKLGSDKLGEDAEPTLLTDLSKDTILAIGGEDLGGQLARVVEAATDGNDEMSTQLTQIEGVLGLKVKDLETAYDGEFALGVGAAAKGPIPPVGFVAEANDDTASATDKLIGAMQLATGSAPKSIKVDGHDAKQASLGGVSLTAATFDKHTFLTNDEKFITGFGNGDTLGDSDAYKSVVEDAEVPDEVGGLFFMDTQKVIALAAGIGADTKGQDTKALGPWIGWLDNDSDSQTFDIFMRIESGGGDA